MAYQAVECAGYLHVHSTIIWRPTTQVINKDWNICDTSRLSESGDSHLIMTSLCQTKSLYCFSLWGVAVWRQD